MNDALVNRELNVAGALVEALKQGGSGDAAVEEVRTAEIHAMTEVVSALALSRLASHAGNIYRELARIRRAGGKL